MTHPLIARRPRHRSRLPYLIAGLVCLTLATLLGLAIYFRFTGHDMTGLEGVWHSSGDPDKRQGYDFKPNGTVGAWNGKEENWWNTIGWDATWRRKGDQITIKTDRNWDFVGELEGDTLRGTMTIRSYPDWTETTAEMVWRKE